MVETAGARKFDRSEGKGAAEVPTKAITAKESAEQAERVAAKKARAEHEAGEKAEREQREERERMRIERRKRIEREERVAGEAKDKADREAEERTEPLSGDEEVDLRTPPTKKDKRGFNSPNFSKVAAPVETTDAGKVDIRDDLGLGSMSARVSISSENERFTDQEQGPPSPKSTPLTPDSVSRPFGAGDASNSSGVRGDTAGNGGNAEKIAMPILTGNGDRQSTFTDTPRDQERENLVEAFLGTDPPRRRNDAPRPPMRAKPTQKPAQVPSPPPAQKSSWVWGGS